MKKSKILSIILLLAMFIISLCLCTNVQAAGTPSFDLDDEHYDWRVFSSIIYPDENLEIEHCLATKDANLRIKCFGTDISDFTQYNFTTDNEDVATIDPVTGKVTINALGEFSVLQDGIVKYKVNVITNEEMENFNKTNDKVNELMDDIEIENADKTAGLYFYAPVEEGCMMQNQTLQLTDMFGKNFSETFPEVTYQVMDNSIVSVDANGKITSNEKRGTTDVYINFGNNVYKSFSMEVVYSWDSYLDWRTSNFGPLQEPGTTTPETTPGTTTQDTPTTDSTQQSTTGTDSTTTNNSNNNERVLDDEPKTGINTMTEVFVSGLAIISLAVVVIAKKNR